MKHRARCVLPAACAAFAATAALPLSPLARFAPLGLAPASAAGASAGAAAQVNNEKILRADLERIVSRYRQSDPSLGTGSAEARAALDEYRRRKLDDLIEQRLLAQEARRLKLAPPRAAVDKVVAGLRSQWGEARFQQMLRGDGKTIEDMRRLVSEELAIRELSQRWTADVTVPEAEIARYYRDNAADFRVQEAQAHHILIAVRPGASATERSQRLQRARAVLRQTQARGANFEKLAAQYSDDARAKAAGGRLSLLRGELSGPWKALEDTAFSAPIGKVVGPVQSGSGFHILRVDARKPPRAAPLAQVRGIIRGVLLNKKIKNLLEQRVRELRAKAKIKKYV